MIFTTSNVHLIPINFYIQVLVSHGHNIHQEFRVQILMALLFLSILEPYLRKERKDASGISTPTIYLYISTRCEGLTMK